MQLSGDGTAEYSWPSGTDIEVELFGTDGPLIAVGVLPRGNEPLGSAFTATLRRYGGEYGRIALVGPIDPPPPEHRFTLPTDPVRLVAHGYLPPPAEQVGLAHCAAPVTAAQHRAAELCGRLAELRPDALLLLHNGICTPAPYLYANAVWPAAQRRLGADLAAEFPHWPGPPGPEPLGERTCAHIPAERFGVRGTECTGLYVERTLGVPTVTVELPMFCWGRAERTRLSVAEAVQAWIARGADHGGDTDRLVCEVIAAIGTRIVRMVPPDVSARVVWSVLAGLHEDLTASRS